MSAYTDPTAVDGITLREMPTALLMVMMRTLETRVSNVRAELMHRGTLQRRTQLTQAALDEARAEGKVRTVGRRTAKTYAVDYNNLTADMAQTLAVLESMLVHTGEDDS